MPAVRRLSPLLVGALLPGCMKQRPPVEPAITIEYRDWDKTVSPRPPTNAFYGLTLVIKERLPFDWLRTTCSFLQHRH